MELKEFLETVKVQSNLDNKQFDEQQKKLIKSFYFTYFGKKLVERCNNCFVDAYFELYNLSKNPEKIYNMENQKFQLKKGILISLHGQVKDLTRANCTDKEAIELLKKHKGHISSFEKYPEDWEKIVNGEMTEKEPTLAELKEKCMELGYPESEWKKLKKQDLVDYINSKKEPENEAK